MALNSYTTLLTPKGLREKLSFNYAIADTTEKFFEEIADVRDRYELDSMNNPLSLAVYTVTCEAYQLYNSDKSSSQMLQELLEKLEDTRDNEFKDFYMRGYAEELHSNLTKSLVFSGIATVIYETR